MVVYIKGMEMPKRCLACEWRDAEAGGDCELMIRNPFKTYTEQYKHCPFQVISKRYSLVSVPPHGRCVDADKLMQEMRLFIKENMLSRDDARELLETIEDAPTIIPAEEGE